MTSAAIRKAPTRSQRLEAGEWLVWLTVLLMLGAGLFVRRQVEGRATTFSGAGVTLRYPADWTLLADDEKFQVFHVVDPASSVQFPTSVRILRIPLGELGRASSSLGDVALSWSTRRGRETPIYSVLQIAPATLRDQPAITIDYAYVAEPALGASASSVPAIVRAQDILLQHGDVITIITFETDTDIYQPELEHFDRVLASLDVK